MRSPRYWTANAKRLSPKSDRSSCEWSAIPKYTIRPLTKFNHQECQPILIRRQSTERRLSRRRQSKLIFFFVDYLGFFNYFNLQHPQQCFVDKLAAGVFVCWQQRRGSIESYANQVNKCNQSITSKPTSTLPLIRFRHLDTTVRLATSSRRNSGANGAGGTTPSPENEFDLQTMQRSPRRSPVPPPTKKEIANSKI